MRIAILLTVVFLATGPSFARAQVVPADDSQTGEVERSLRAADAALFARDRRWARDELRAAEELAPEDGRVDLARAAVHHHREPSLALAFEPEEAAGLASEHDGWELERRLGLAFGVLGAVAGLGSGVLAAYGTLDDGCHVFIYRNERCVSRGPNETALAFGVATGFLAAGLAISSFVMLVDSLFRRGHWLDVMDHGDLRFDVGVGPTDGAPGSGPSVGIGISGRLP